MLFSHREKKHSISSNGGKVGHDEGDSSLFFHKSKKAEGEGRLHLKTQHTQSTEGTTANISVVSIQTQIRIVSSQWMSTAAPTLPPTPRTARMRPGTPRPNGITRECPSTALLKVPATSSVTSELLFYMVYSSKR